MRHMPVGNVAGMIQWFLTVLPLDTTHAYFWLQWWPI